MTKVAPPTQEEVKAILNDRLANADAHQVKMPGMHSLFFVQSRLPGDDTANLYDISTHDAPHRLQNVIASVDVALLKASGLDANRSSARLQGDKTYMYELSGGKEFPKDTANQFIEQAGKAASSDQTFQAFYESVTKEFESHEAQKQTARTQAASAIGGMASSVGVGGSENQAFIAPNSGSPVTERQC